MSLLIYLIKKSIVKESILKKSPLNMKSHIISGCIFNQMQIYILKYIVNSFLKGYKNLRKLFQILLYPNLN